MLTCKYWLPPSVVLFVISAGAVVVVLVAVVAVVLVGGAVAVVLAGLHAVACPHTQTLNIAIIRVHGLPPVSIYAPVPQSNTTCLEFELEIEPTLLEMR